MTGLDVKVIYRDQWLLAVDKPAGLLVIPTGKGERNTLTQRVNDYLDAQGVAANAYPGHRIDRETSGVILYAQGKQIQQALMQLFKERRVVKTYLAIVHGVLARPSGTIRHPVFNRSTGRREQAETRYTVLARARAFTVLRVVPVTGRTNQIRIHCKDIGHPIVGESLYAFRKDFALKFRRTALHAWSLSVPHPVTGRQLSVEAPLAPDMDAFLREHGVRALVPERPGVTGNARVGGKDPQ